MHARLKTDSDIASFEKVVAWADATIAEWSGTDLPTMQIHLVLEELVTNAMRHGYGPNTSGTIWLELGASQPKGSDRPSVMVRVEDAAAAYDPFEMQSAVDTNASVEDRDIGGLGVFLVHEMADFISYQRINGRNRIEIWFGPPQDADFPKNDPAKQGAVYDGPAPRSLAMRFAVSFFLVFLLSMAGAGALNFFKFERVFIETAGRQFDGALQEARLAVEGSLGAGLTLASNFSTQVVVDKQVRQQDGAFHLAVTDLDGKILFAPAMGQAFARLPPERLQHPTFDTHQPIRFGNTSGLGAAVPIHQDGVTVGFMVLSFEPIDAVREMDRLRGVLLRVGVLVAIIFAPCVALISYLALAPIERRHVRQAQDLIAGDPDAKTDGLGHNLAQIGAGLLQLEAPVVHKAFNLTTSERPG